MRTNRIVRIVFSFVALTLLPHSPVQAQAVETKAKQMILVDDSSGTVLMEKNADERMHPSSMSKLMTIYMVFKQLKEGSLKLTDTLPVSENAWRMQGSKTFVDINTNVTVEDLLRGVIVQSGNDACIVLAEGLAGSEPAFAEQMNAAAQELGLTNSHFVNSTGWPDPNHLTTARDLATLAKHLIHDFPEYYHYFAEKEFIYHNIKQENRNLLLYKNIGVDGLKTGHTEEAGYGIVVSGVQNDRRLILVVNGLTSMAERGQEAEALLNYGWRAFQNKKVLSQGQVVDQAEVWFGNQRMVPLVALTDVTLTLPKTNMKETKLVLKYTGPIPAPVKKGAHVADLEVTPPGGEPMLVPLVAGEDVEKLSGIARLLPALDYYIFGRK